MLGAKAAGYHGRLICLANGAQRARSVTTAVVEAKKDRCAYDAAPKSPEGSADAPPPPLIEEIAPILPQ